MLRKEYLVEILKTDPALLEEDRTVQHTRICKGRREVIDYINNTFNGAKICTKDILQTKLHNSGNKKLNKILRDFINVRVVA